MEECNHKVEKANSWMLSVVCPCGTNSWQEGGYFFAHVWLNMQE